MERNIISERTIAGLTSAKAKGRIGGRKPGLTDQAKRKAKLAAIEYTKYLQNEIGTIDDVCRIVGVSRATLYKYLRIEGINIQGSKDKRIFSESIFLIICLLIDNIKFKYKKYLEICSILSNMISLK